MRQTTRTYSLLAVVLIAGLGSLGTAAAATIIAGIGVDIGTAGPAFTGMGVLGETFVGTSGANQTNTVIGTNGADNVTLTLSSSFTDSGGFAGNLDQNTTGSPNALFRDFVAAGNDSSGTAPQGTISLTISGLTPNALYSLVAYAGSSNGGDSTQFTGALVGTVNAMETASRNVFQAGGNYLLNPSVAASGTGTIAFTATPGAGNRFAIVNGFGIQAVPEPTSVALLLGALGIVILRRRRA